MKFKVPIRVSVAPVRTFTKTIIVEASSRKEAIDLIRGDMRPGNSILSDAINSPGWKAVGGRMEPARPDRTSYEAYLDEDALNEWGAL